MNIIYWNVEGIFPIYALDASEAEVLIQAGILALCETWRISGFQPWGEWFQFKAVTVDARASERGRNSGGLAIMHKTKIFRISAFYLTLIF